MSKTITFQLKDILTFSVPRNVDGSSWFLSIRDGQKTSIISEIPISRSGLKASSWALLFQYVYTPLGISSSLFS